jgi:hypothetical protein
MTQPSEQQDTAVAGPSTWRREAAIAAGSATFGLIALPFAVYLVGQRLLGDYDSGALGLAENIWRDFLSLQLPAWLLVLSPYVMIQLFRFARRVWRPRL